MSETKHTPGPWAIEPRKCGFGYWVNASADGEGVSICEICYDDGAEADARLIAAAPDLLAALKEALNVMPLGLTSRIDWMAVAQAAIAKAEGRV